MEVKRKSGEKWGPEMGQRGVHIQGPDGGYHPYQGKEATLVSLTMSGGSHWRTGFSGVR